MARRRLAWIALALALALVAALGSLGAVALAGSARPDSRAAKDRLVARALAPAAPVARAAAGPAARAGAPSPPRFPRPPATADAAPGRAGVIGTQESLGGVPLPFPAGYLHVVNLWQGRRGGAAVSVYAGALGADPSHGVLVTATVDPRTGSLTLRRYDGPAGAGALRLVAVRDGVARVASSAGVRRAVDLAARGLLPR